MRRKLDGVLLLDKPVGLSSSAALQAVKRLVAAAKAGHAGTLDPLACGLLPLLFGEATKFARFGLDAPKSYDAEFRLGVTTDTGDAEGKVIERRRPEIGETRLQEALQRFRGDIGQVPPMYSALKRAGRPLYEIARSGGSVERAPRKVTIYEFELVERQGDLLRFRVRCSKGTYIRQLAADLGAELGTGAHLEALRRTAVGGFTLDRAVTLDALQTMDEREREARLLPVDSLLQGLPRLDLEAGQAERFLNGQVIGVESPGGPCRVYRRAGPLLGIGRIAPEGRLQPLRLLARD